MFSFAFGAKLSLSKHLIFSGMFDADRSGTIDFNEFSALWQYVSDWSNTFRSYDLDNSGAIDKRELIIGYLQTNILSSTHHNRNTKPSLDIILCS